jgi:hypothetical protein
MSIINYLLIIPNAIGRLVLGEGGDRHRNVMPSPVQGVKRKQLSDIVRIKYSASGSNIQKIQTLLDKMATWALVNGFTYMRNEKRMDFPSNMVGHFNNIGPLKFVRRPPYFVRNPDFRPYPANHIKPARDINRIYDAFHAFPSKCALTLKHIIEIRETGIQIEVLFPHSTQIELLGPNDKKVSRVIDDGYDGSTVSMGEFIVLAPDGWDSDEDELDECHNTTGGPNSWHINEPALLVNPNEVSVDDSLHEFRPTWIANDAMLKHLMMVDDPQSVQNLAEAA